MMYHIPCAWEMYGILDIEAESLGEAVDRVQNGDGELPEGSYVEDSFKVDHEAVQDYNKEALWV